MEKIVKSCGECDFLHLKRYGDYDCEHPDTNNSGFWVSGNYTNAIHPNCPEKGAFIIITKKIEDD